MAREGVAATSDVMPLAAIIGTTPPSLARDANFAAKVLGVRMRVQDLARLARRSRSNRPDAFGPLPELILRLPALERPLDE